MVRQAATNSIMVLRPDAYRVTGSSEREALCNPVIGKKSLESTADQELILLGIRRVCLDLDRTLPGHNDNPSESVRFKRSKRKEEIGKAMTASEYAINSVSIEAIAPASLTRIEGEASPDDNPRREQASDQNVCAQVHVMVAVKATWLPAIEAAELIGLGGRHILEGAG